MLMFYDYLFYNYGVGGKNKMETIGDRIKKKRKEAKMTQLELANKLSVTDRAVSKWEQNEGNPDISILPKIAEIFNVTLDYLMTGSEPKKEIIIMSKLELCAKSDDPTMIKSLTSDRDENGKNLLDYVKKYNSKKVLKALIDNHSYQNYYNRLLQRASTVSATKMAIEIMLTCIPVDREREVIEEVFHSEIRTTDDKFIEALKCNINESIEIAEGLKSVFKFLVENYDGLSKKQKEYYFNLAENEEESGPNCWITAYPYFVEYAILENNDALYEMLISQIERHNKWVETSKTSIKKQHRNSEYDYYLQFFKGVNLYLLPSTFNYLISKKNFRLAYRVNALLRNPHTKREIELLEVENNDTINEKEKIEFRCIDCHMIVLEEIEKLKDLTYIKEILDNNYVNYYEMVYKLLKTNKKALFKFFVDNNLIELSELLMNDNEKKLLNQSWVYFNYHAGDELTLKQSIIITNDSKKASKDKKYVYYRDFEYKLAELIDTDLDFESQKTSDNAIIKYFEMFKNDVFNKIKTIIDAENKEKEEKLEKARLTKELTRPYFENLLLMGNEDMFIVKLCSLFETILRFDYKCDHDNIYENMKQFFDKGPKSRDIDDGWGYMTLDTEYEERYVKPWNEKKDLMNKLRLKRNSIVHPERNEHADLSEEELKKCLDFVFAANGGNIFNE